MALPKTEIVDLDGTQCTIFTEVRSVRLGHDARATRQTWFSIMTAGREIASASSKATAIARARKTLASS